LNGLSSKDYCKFKWWYEIADYDLEQFMDETAGLLFKLRGIKIFPG